MLKLSNLLVIKRCSIVLMLFVTLSIGLAVRRTGLSQLCKDVQSFNLTCRETAASDKEQLVLWTEFFVRIIKQNYSKITLMDFWVERRADCRNSWWSRYSTFLVRDCDFLTCVSYKLLIIVFVKPLWRCLF